MKARARTLAPARAPTLELCKRARRGTRTGDRRKPTSRVNDSPRERWRDRPARFAFCPFSLLVVSPYSRGNVVSAPVCPEYSVRTNRWSFDRISVYNRSVYADNFRSYVWGDPQPPVSWGWVLHPCQVLDPFVAATAAVDLLYSTDRPRSNRESRLIGLERCSEDCLRYWRY